MVGVGVGESEVRIENCGGESDEVLDATGD
jgi:hypothetical protein